MKPLSWLIVFALVLVVGGAAGVGFYLASRGLRGPQGPPATGRYVPPVSSVKELRAHRFWKRAPSAAELEKLLDEMTHPGARGSVNINGEGAIWWEHASEVVTKGPRFSGLWTSFWPEAGSTRAEAAGQVKRALDRALAGEDFRRRVKRPDAGGP